MTSELDLRPLRSRRIPRLLIAGLVPALVGLAVYNTPEPTGLSEADPTGPYAGGVSEEANGEPDFHPLDYLSGIDGAISVVSGTVVDTTGPQMTLREDGSVDYRYVDEWPAVVLSETKYVAGLNRGPDFKDVEKAIRSLAKSGELRLWNGSGWFEPGKRYAFFVGWWDVDEYSVLYAHDLSTDRPAAGFKGAQPADALDSLVAGVSDADRSNVRLERGSERAPETQAVRTLIHTATEMNTRRHQPEVEGPVAPSLDLTKNYAAVPQDLADPADAADLMYVELVLFAPEGTSTFFGLKNQRAGKTLGWFGTNDQGFATIQGYVDPGSTMQVLSRGGPGRDVQAFPLARFGIAGNKIELPDAGPGGQAFGIVDLRGKSRSSEVVTFMTGAEFEAKLSGMESELDGGAAGYTKTDDLGSERTPETAGS